MPVDPQPRKQANRPPKNLICGFASPAVIAAQGTMRIVKGRGVYVWDDRGRKYIDGLASLWNVAVGHGRAEIARAVAKQIRDIEFVPSLLGFSSPVAEELATRIVRMAPKGLTRIAFTSGGSEANESVIRLVRLYWRLRGKQDKFKIVALNRAYHGSSTGAASLTGLPFFHQYYEPLLEGVVRMPRPFCYRCELKLTYPSCGIACADELEKIIRREGTETVGAFIAEPVQGVGGVVIPPDGYFQRIREICDKYDILLINDEVITGFGRLGHNFGIDRWKVVPDMISFAKSVTSGYLPLGGVLMKEEIYQALVAAGPDFSLHHGFTYSGHPAACAAGLANLDIIERERLVMRTRKLAPVLARRLQTLVSHRIVGEVRAAGLMAALELVRDKTSREPLPADWKVPQRIRNACLERGVIVRASVDTIAICPPLIIKEKEIDTIVVTIDAAVAEVCQALTL